MAIVNQFPASEPTIKPTNNFLITATNREVLYLGQISLDSATYGRHNDTFSIDDPVNFIYNGPSGGGRLYIIKESHVGGSYYTSLNLTNGHHYSFRVKLKQYWNGNYYHEIVLTDNDTNENKMSKTVDSASAYNWFIKA